MFTAMLSVENITGADHDVWSVNVDQEYSEEIKEGEDSRRRDLAQIGATQPLVPEAVSSLDPSTAALQQAFARIDKLALALAVGTVSSCYILLATLWLLILGLVTAGAARRGLARSQRPSQAGPRGWATPTPSLRPLSSPRRS